MLNPALNRQALTRRALVATTVALLGITLPIAAFRAAAQNAPLLLSGTVYDASGAVLPGVNLTLEDIQQVKSQATTDSAGPSVRPAVRAICSPRREHAYARPIRKDSRRRR